MGFPAKEKARPPSGPDCSPGLDEADGVSVRLLPELVDIIEDAVFSGCSLIFNFPL